MPNAPITIRPAKHSDLPAIARLLAAAFWDEDAMGRFQHPLRHRYPDDVRRHWHRALRASLLSWRNVVLVAQNEVGVLVGVADWRRCGEQHVDAGLRSGWRWVLRRPISWFLYVTNKLLSILRPNRANDAIAASALRQMPRYLAQILTAQDYTDLWVLEVIGVHPEYQANGYGTALVRAGLERVDADGLAAAVVSAAGREAWYRGKGFAEWIGNVTRGEGNGLAGIEGGDVLVRWGRR